jgi:hypothetical protein
MERRKKIFTAMSIAGANLIGLALAAVMLPEKKGDSNNIARIRNCNSKQNASSADA